MVYLSGGNDALSTVVPYQDPFYYSRRPAIAIPAGQVLQIGSDSTGKTLGLHPRLAGLREIFNQGRLAVVQRTGYLNSEPITFSRHRHLGHCGSKRTNGARVAGPLPRHAARARQHARRMEHDAGNATRAHDAKRKRSSHSGCAYV